jgi:hypothetical protein
LFDSKPIGNLKTVSTGPGYSWKNNTIQLLFLFF